MNSFTCRMVLLSLALLMICGASFAGSSSVKVPGSTWIVPLTVAYDLGKAVGKYRINNVDSTFSFGPQNGLSSNQFAWLCDGLDRSSIIVNTYTVKQKTISIVFNKSDVENLIYQNLVMIAKEAEGVTLKNLKVSIFKLKPCSGEVGRDKKGAWLKVSFSTEFNYSFTVAGKQFKGKGKLDVSGKGK